MVSVKHKVTHWHGQLAANSADATAHAVLSQTLQIHPWKSRPNTKTHKFNQCFPQVTWINQKLRAEQLENAWMHMSCVHMHARYVRIAHTHTHTHTHTRLMALCPGLPGWAGTSKVKPIWILLKQETVSGSGISWAVCKRAPCSRQITTPAPHSSIFTGRMPFLPPNQQRQSTEGIAHTDGQKNTTGPPRHSNAKQGSLQQCLSCEHPT